jgi:hypothetical protein
VFCYQLKRVHARIRPKPVAPSITVSSFSLSTLAVVLHKSNLPRRG